MGFLQVRKFVDKKYKIVCGIDEAGRGPWAGPLVACALVLDRGVRIGRVRDSKKMLTAKRKKFYEILRKKSAYGIGIVSAQEIDAKGLAKCVNLVFKRAVKDLDKKTGIKPNFLLVDGKDKLKFSYPFKTLIGGDDKIKEIACASIIAKVERDRIMTDLAKKFPKYGFEIHKGYGTARHQNALKKHGICAIHRRSYAPIKALM
jgi:ribonuclease HII